MTLVILVVLLLATALAAQRAQRLPLWWPTDRDGAIDACEACPSDPAKDAPGQCGCGIPDNDSDSDGIADCVDGCPSDAAKSAPGVCGCDDPDVDIQGDGTIDCGMAVFKNAHVPLVVGAPALKRYTVFGNLFATAGDVTYRIDLGSQRLAQGYLALVLDDALLTRGNRTGSRSEVLGH